MSIAVQQIAALSRSTNPKEDLIKAAGDLSGLDVMHNQILVATYIRPEKTAGGIIRPNSNLQEDEYQGKVGLVLKIGPTAFVNGDDIDFAGQKVSVGDWVVYRVGDGWQVTINKLPCRLLTDRAIRLRVTKPEDIY